MKKGAWNVKDEEILVENHSRLSISKLAELLGRTPKSVESKVWMMKQTNRL